VAIANLHSDLDAVREGRLAVGVPDADLAGEPTGTTALAAVEEVSERPARVAVDREAVLIERPHKGFPLGAVLGAAIAAGSVLAIYMTLQYRHIAA
jgi:hypothetical protein